jgi:DNA-binding XRE family transcriptional regulator
MKEKSLAWLSNRGLPEKAATGRSRSEPMKRTKKARLEAAGWKAGTADQLLGLSKQESEYVSLKLALAEGIRLRRRLRHLTQNELAKFVGSSQSRIAKMEAADPTVALDLMVRSLFATGVGRRELAGIIQRRGRSTAAGTG